MTVQEATRKPPVRKKPQVAIMNAVHDLPVLAARDLGYFTDEGLDIDFIVTPELRVHASFTNQSAKFTRIGDLGTPGSPNPTFLAQQQAVLAQNLNKNIYLGTDPNDNSKHEATATFGSGKLPDGARRDRACGLGIAHRGTRLDHVALGDESLREQGLLALEVLLRDRQSRIGGSTMT